MADQQDMTQGSAQDMEQAEESFAIFNTVFKWGTVFAVVATILVVAIIASRAA
jgi:heme/copper-type cytochrome/quinol oxidase subunit 2